MKNFSSPISQKARASRRATVMRTTLAIILNLRLRLGPAGSFERLVFAEVADRKAQGINGDQLVRHAALEHKNEVGGVQIALEFAVVGGRVVDQVEIDAGPAGGILHFFQSDFLDVDIDLRRGGGGEESPDDVLFVIGIENALVNFKNKKVQGLEATGLDRLAVTSIVELGELRNKILGFGVL